ncbi:MAG: hypothetical protein KF718_19510 [Polyangiaceae bacterium]|nr:hypothetical protein [Polyangiaceae bacterium]
MRVLVGLFLLATACDGRGDCERASRDLVFRGGSLLDGAHLTAGEPLTCDDGRVRRAAPRLSEALAHVDPRFLPRPVVVHLDPRATGGAPVREIEAHASGQLLVSSSTPAVDDPSVVLHELFHLGARGRRPEGARQRRAFVALEEGAADYFAASVLRVPEVGTRDGRERRRLDGPERPTVGEWLDVISGSAPPHALGQKLGSALWSVFGADGSRAVALGGCLATVSSEPVTLAGFVDECARVTPDLREPLTRWMVGEPGYQPPAFALSSPP